ncbi:hypothetical protein P4518_13925, partial [Geobacillus thermodenitrificans]|uniref:hypothetical protein n=1 Tax=Geobacillus thermodenitrificans TaxID=33940 RepID=UPI002E1E6516|nr:hypothetical protein [Geobacillus thermodenitrificans]
STSTTGKNKYCCAWYSSSLAWLKAVDTHEKVFHYNEESSCLWRVISFSFFIKNVCNEQTVLSM